MICLCRAVIFIRIQPEAYLISISLSNLFSLMRSRSTGFVNRKQMLHTCDGEDVSLLGASSSEISQDLLVTSCHQLRSRWIRTDFRVKISLARIIFRLCRHASNVTTMAQPDIYISHTVKRNGTTRLFIPFVRSRTSTR